MAHTSDSDVLAFEECSGASMWKPELVESTKGEMDVRTLRRTFSFSRIYWSPSAFLVCGPVKMCGDNRIGHGHWAEF